MDRIIYTKISENGKCYRVRTIIGKLCLSLLVLEEAGTEISAYEASKILEQNLRKQVEKLDISVDDYFKKIISFLENPKKVKFTFTKNSLTIEEAINSKIHAKYLHCDLIKITNFSSFIGNLIDDLHSQNSDFEKNRCDLTEKCQLLEKEVDAYKNKLNELVERKRVDDQVMLSNFVSLLNEKKRRIQHLNELLEAFREDPSLANPAEVNVNSTRKRKWKDTVKNEKQTTATVVKEEVSDSESGISNNENTSDEEKNQNFTEVKIEETSVANQYIDDIFEESPPGDVPPLPKILRKPNSGITPTSVPSTSRDNIQSSNDDQITSVEPKTFDTTVVDINTQDLLDRLYVS
ncbi:hypothetical protein HHI36_000819 [Cryptolaemus montrouzieri]|uniref:XRCC4 n=1 Tax=Cryptolaemus montrouzieri TaxID=559131 RepID=A0ABD2P742_9CUCU